ncbi:MAG TPA: CvpA family protein [Pyrinomonadaceae bacterium]|jgi:membrane protein required for colicin V production
MTFFDLIVLALVGASLLAGALRGFVRALVATLAMLAGVVVGARNYETAGLFLRGLNVVESSAAANACGFLLIVGLALALGFVAGQFLKGGLRRARLEWMDRVLGALFGFARGMAVCSVIYLALTAFPVRLETVAEARTAPALAVGAKLISWLTSAELRARFEAEYRRLTS